MAIVAARTLYREVFPEGEARELVRLYRAADGDAWSIPWPVWDRQKHYPWWGKALEHASRRGVAIEVVVVTTKGQAGFRFHTPGTYTPTYTGSPLDEAARVSKDRTRHPARDAPTVDTWSTNEWIAFHAELAGMDPDLWRETNME